MLIEGMKQICLVFEDGVVHLTPGFPVYFPEHRAHKILERAGGKVRVVAFVMWQSSGRRCGPAKVELIDDTKDGKWLLVSYKDNYKWVSEHIVIAHKCGGSLPE